MMTILSYERTRATKYLRLPLFLCVPKTKHGTRYVRQYRQFFVFTVFLLYFVRVTLYNQSRYLRIYCARYLICRAAYRRLERRKPKYG